MEKDQKFPEQNAPEKNTDNAFVQVGEDGSPVIPSPNEMNTNKTENENSATEDRN